jgi:ABC-type multidrug transport system ATPase subunit
MSVVVVEVVGVSKKYGNVTALEDVSLEVKRGEMFCVMGPGGAGDDASRRDSGA